tara:strand:- start:186 stop:350 length:165 start_codon:yes stop_codon:yes gene_type:complete
MRKVQKSFSTLILILDYLDKHLFEEFLIKKFVDSIDDLTSKAAIRKLEINELPP